MSQTNKRLEQTTARSEGYTSFVTRVDSSST
ncbi:hypothetical protein Gotri_024590 [Gossypium trilobum]|uniref:Uncharacterized protein n=1 Tax=Gossypium trilobum TaxID=34281 RepID=A0A7J9DMR6_9ROSI|nr:hypothetical protein [Gossypium trilobum]